MVSAPSARAEAVRSPPHGPLMLLGVSLGDAALACFVLCALSGALLLPAFDTAEGLASIAVWLLANPGATVLRNLHYWTAQLWLVLMLLHAWDHLRHRRDLRLRRGVWLRLVASLPVMALLMLTGFLLRDDADAEQARLILQEMLALVPFIGTALVWLLLGSGEASQQVLLVQHAATATLVVWLVIAEHARRLWGSLRATAAASVVCGVLALLISPGLHDGLHPVVKGPWYFLGLQELLHWSTWPAWMLLAAAATLAWLAALPRMSPRGRTWAERGLWTGVGGYLLLCLLVLFVRGAQWEWAPGWPDGPADWRAGPALERVGADPAQAELPVVLGRPEGCLACHGAMTGFSPAHQPQAVGCAACHGGDPFTLDASRAHAGMVLIPGNMADAARSCGLSGCHAEVVPRVERSIMNTYAGVVATNRWVFGEDPHAGAAPGQPPHVRQLGHSAADSHLRQLCVGCHLDQPKTRWGPIDQRSRGGGCNACHLHYSLEARAELQAYAPNPAQAAAAADAGVAGGTRPFPTEHPRLTVQASGTHCFGCHSRSSRIATSYEGWHEMRHPPPPALRAQQASQYRQLQDGRFFERQSADLHHTAGMDCIDCHTSLEVMGSGHTVAHKTQALRVRCQDCHAAPGAQLAWLEAGAIDPESRKIMALRGWSPAPGQRVGATRSGDTLLNITVDEAGQGTLRRKATGRASPLKPQSAACSGDSAHQRLNCNSCHTAWAPQCTHCHTEFDPQGTAHDYLDRKPVVGAWRESSTHFGAGPPALGVRRADGHGEPGGELVDTFVPGMIMTLDRNRIAGGPPDTVFRRLFAPSAAHTIQRAARPCASCHVDAVALGYGKGRLWFEPDPLPAAGSAQPRGGTWHFQPQQALLPQDGLPADAWTGFLAERSDRASTHEGARPFSVAEQQRILTVGACLGCHAGDAAPMRDALRDFDATLQRRKPVCAAPTWVER